MTSQEKLKQGFNIQNRIIHHPVYKKSQHIAVYLHLNNEVPTDLIIADILARNKICYVPRIDGDVMSFKRVYDQKDVLSFPPGVFGILEPPPDPEREDPILLKHLDLVIIPGLGFDQFGGRLGKGKGYYDRFISQCEQVLTERPFLIGIAWKEQMVDRVPMEPTDRMLHQVIYGDPL